MEIKGVVEKLLAGLIINITECCKEIIVEVDPGNIFKCLTALKNDENIGFDFLVDVVGVDNSQYMLKKPKKGAEAESEESKVSALPRYEVVYLLLSIRHNKRLIVKVRISEEKMSIDSVTSIWKASTWPEREVYDMYGIKFIGHPDMRRLLMWDEFKDHPLRKDYPLEGKGEKRVLIYE